MAKKAQESRQRMESMLTQPAEYADKSCAMLCIVYRAVSVLVDTDTKVRNLLNYQATVASSYQAIDDDISRMYPNLKRNNKQDLRTYVLSLKSQFPKLTDSICDNYVRVSEVFDCRLKRMNLQSSAIKNGRRICSMNGRFFSKISPMHWHLLTLILFLITPFLSVRDFLFLKLLMTMKVTAILLFFVHERSKITKVTDVLSCVYCKQ